MNHKDIQDANLKLQHSIRIARPSGQVVDLKYVERLVTKIEIERLQKLSKNELIEIIMDKSKKLNG